MMAPAWRARHLSRGLGVFLLVAAACHPGVASAADDPAAFLTGLGNRVVGLIRNKQDPAAQRKRQFEQIALQAFDVPKIAQFVLGRYWRVASDAQREQFEKAFEAYMIQVYWSRFNQYAVDSFKVTGQRPEGKNTTLVNSEILQSNGQRPVKVDWWVTKPEGAYKITDVSIAGVSQAITYRQEFASVIERNGGQITPLTDQLRQKASS